MEAARALLAWRGDAYGGWQLQPDVPTVQAAVEQAVSRIMDVERVVVRAAGRLDAGVHAEAQVVAFDVPADRSAHALWRGMNGLLPDDIACLALAATHRGFDPRRANSGKTYRYRVLTRATKCPFRRRSCWHVGRPLDVSAMQTAAAALVGRHDFSSFRASGCSATHPNRRVRALQVTTDGDEVRILVDGEAFLRHQVRIMAGALVEVGLARRPPRWMVEVLQARDRAAGARTAPAHGLCLERVHFSPPLSWDVGQAPSDGEGGAASRASPP